jgi:hypothetical protein
MLLTDCTFSANSVDLSASIKSIQINEKTNTTDKSVMGGTNKLNGVGLDEWDMSTTFLQAYGTGSVEATLSAIRAGRVAVTVVSKPTSAAVGTSNPSFTGSAVLTGFTPVAGNHGDEQVCVATWACAGTLTRATS